MIKTKPVIILIFIIMSISMINAKDLFLKEQIKIDKNDEIRNIYIDDYNSDGKKDFFIIGKNYWYLFCQKNGKFNKNPDVKLRALKTIYSYDFGNVANDKNMELVFITKDGVYYTDLFSKNNKSYKIIDKETVYNFFNEANEMYNDYTAKTDFLINISENEYSDIFVPTLYGLNLFENKNNKYTLKENFSNVGSSYFYANRGGKLANGEYIIDNPEYDNYNNDNIKDLWFFRVNDIVLYIQNGKNIFGKKIIIKKPFEFKDENDDFIRVKDIQDVNYDGIADIVAAKVKMNTLFSMKSQTQIFYGKQIKKNKQFDFIYNKSPDYVNTIDGTVIEMKLVDMVKNGKNELMIFKFQINIYKAIKSLISSTVPLELKIFKLDRKNNFEKMPYKTVELKMYFSFSGNTANSILTYSKDFSGDGYNDIIVQTGNNEVSIYPNIKDNYSNSGVVEFDIESLKEKYEYKCEYINDDQKSDLVLYFDKKNYLNIYYSNW